jgi:hypothetical protein
MTFFKFRGKGNKKKENQEESVYMEDVTKVGGKKLTSDQVRVVIFNKLGSDVGNIKGSFIADRYPDSASGVTRIKSDALVGFDVLEPTEDVEVVKDDNNDSINLKVTAIKKKLKEKKGKPNPSINERDLTVELAKLRINKHRNLFKNGNGSMGSYYYIGKDGSKTLMFLEDRDEFIPLRVNLENYTVHTDCGSKKKPASVAMSNTLKKFESKLMKAIEGRLLWFLTILIIGIILTLAAGLYVMKKYNDYDDMYENSNIVSMQKMMVNNTYGCLDKLQQLQSTGKVTYSDSQIEDIKYKQTKSADGNS